MHPALARFCERLPAKPRCADDFNFGSRVLPREAALKRKYIQIGSSRLVGYLVFDIDAACAVLAPELARLPEPTLTVINPENKHAHLMYELAAPVSLGDQARKSPQLYLKAIENGFFTKLARFGADSGYVGLLTKNPTHASWLTVANDVSYELSVLAEYVDLSRSACKVEVLGVGRNCGIFDAVRRWAYQNVQEAASRGEFFGLVMNECNQCNTYQPPLPQKEILSICKSITNWTWSNRNKFGGNGVSQKAVDRVRKAAQQVADELGVEPEAIMSAAPGEIVKASGLSSKTVQRVIRKVHGATGTV